MKKTLVIIGLLLPGSLLRAATLNVPAGGDFQSALKSAQPGDLIILQAGASYNTGVGFTLPVKPTGSSFITIQSSDLSALPAAGYRVSPGVARHMPKLVATANGVPVLQVEKGAHHYQFIGVEFAEAPGIWSYGMVQLGTGIETTVTDSPHYITLDRCYIHGDPTAQPGTKGGVMMNGVNLSVLNSYISEIHVVGQDNQGINCRSGAGPLKIINNYIEAATENILFGGAAPMIPNLVPSDIEIRNNYFYKPLTWKVDDPSYKGIHWDVKNLFELKNAQRVVVDGNIFENNWKDAQVGFAIVLTPRASDATAPWSVVKDVTFTHNIIRHSASGVNTLSSDDARPSQPLQNVTIRDNLFQDINPQVYGGDGRLFQFVGNSNGTATQIVVDHNTSLHTNGGNSMASVGDCCTVVDGFTFTNNLMTHGTYGFFGGGSSEGTSSLNKYMTNWTLTKNAIIGPNKASVYPAGNFFPPDAATVQFTNFAGGDFRLAAGSPYKAAGTDGKDLGADINAINSATCGVIAGVPQSSCSSVTAVSQCDINRDGITNVSDVQLTVIQALGKAACSSDLNKDGRCDVVDVQKVANAALGNICTP